MRHFALSMSIFVSAVAFDAHAAATCSPVSGSVVTTYVPQNCTSPYGVCTTGTLDAGSLSGTTSFVATSLTQQGVVTIFSGLYTVTTSTGTATFDTTGVLNNVTGRYTETFRLVSGTGSFEGASGNLFSTGFATATGFEGTLTGALCE